MSGEHLDLASEPPESARPRPPAPAKPFLGINFQCCRTYARIYLNADQSAFVGHCPRCGRRVEILVSPDGSDSRYFTAY